MIDHHYKCIFIHVPRTGGTSIVQSITGSIWEDLPDEHRFGEKHMNTVDARKLYAEWWDSYFKFTIVRNPYDWLVSMWNIVDCGDDPFEKYVRDVVECGYVTKHHINREFHVQAKGLDFVGHFETLRQDFQRVCARINCPMSLFHTGNRSPRVKEYWRYYDMETRALVREAWSRDLANYNYKF